MRDFISDRPLFTDSQPMADQAAQGDPMSRFNRNGHDFSESDAEDGALYCGNCGKSYESSAPADSLCPGPDPDHDPLCGLEGVPCPSCEEEAEAACCSQCNGMPHGTCSKCGRSNEITAYTSTLRLDIDTGNPIGCDDEVTLAVKRVPEPYADPNPGLTLTFEDSSGLEVEIFLTDEGARALIARLTSVLEEK